MKLKNLNSNKILTFTSLVFLILVNLSLVQALDVDFYDTYSGQGSNSLDKISWVDTFPPTYYTVLGVLGPINTPLCYCVNEDRNIDSVYEFCICKDSSARTSCSGVTDVFPVVDTTGTSSWYNADVVDVYLDIGSGGNAFYETSKTVKMGQIKYFCDIGSGCQACGSTGSSTNYNYYFIDQTFNVCDFDGSDDYEIRGYYGVSQHVLVDSETCATYLVCDTDHDGQTSSSPTTKPTHPCKIDTDTPVICSDSSECWNNAVCSGARFEYGGVCDGTLVDISINEYGDNCGGDGALVTITNGDQNVDCSSQGYPSGYVCDETLDGDAYSSLALVYSNVCKGGIGNSCTVNSDCYNALDCNSGFCGYSATAVFTDSEDDNKNYSGVSITFDPSLSTSSDDNISYACWYIDDVAVKCNGNSFDCIDYCGVIRTDFDWSVNYIKTFNSGGDFDVKLKIGNQDLYSDIYSETYCISGDGNTCYSCVDNIRNDDETDIDWGGNCGKPYFIKCNNNILDNVTNESSVDYGGDCGSCDNSSINTDEDLVFLIQSSLIEYPFTSDQCQTTTNVKGGIIVFFLIVGSIIIIPLLFLLLILLLLLALFGTGVVGLLVAGVRNKRKFLSLLVDLVQNNRNNKKMKK